MTAVDITESELNIDALAEALRDWVPPRGQSEVAWRGYAAAIASSYAFHSRPSEDVLPATFTPTPTSVSKPYAVTVTIGGDKVEGTVTLP